MIKKLYRFEYPPGLFSHGESISEILKRIKHSENIPVLYWASTGYDANKNLMELTLEFHVEDSIDSHTLDDRIKTQIRRYIFILTGLSPVSCHLMFVYED